jgi:YVTN family beta-propeller protein
MITPAGRIKYRFALFSALLAVALSIFRPQAQAADAESLGAAAGFLLVANKGDHTLGLIDSKAGREIATIAEEGATGHEVAASLDGRLAFVPIYGTGGVGSPGTDGSLIRVIDLSSRKIVGTVDFGRGVRPHCAVTGPKSGLIYVTTELDESVSLIDPKTLKIVDAISTGKPESHMLAISRAEDRAYTANVASGTISVLNLETRKLITTIPAASKIQRIALSADDRHIVTADQSHPRLVVIDVTTNRVSDSIALPGLGFSTAATPDGRWLIATLSGLNRVALIDLRSMEISQLLNVPPAPQEVLIRPDGAVAYVSCDASREVVAIDLKQWKIAQTIAAGQGADGLAWVRSGPPDLGK